MKGILIFAAYFYPHLGGVEKYAYELSRRLVQRGYEVDIVTCNTEGALAYEELDGIHIYRLPSWNALDSRYPIPKPCPTSFRILRKLLDKDYNVVNTVTRFFVASFLGLIFAKIRRVPLTHTELGAGHSIGSGKVVDSVGQAYDHTVGSLIVKSARVNIGISEAICEFLKHLGARNIRLIYDGIDTATFRKRDTDLRQRLGIANDICLITFVGRLIYAKGVQDLVSALPRAKTVVPNIELLIVGDEPYRAKLERLTLEAGCAQDITFLGEKPPTEIVDILSATDIFINPSYSEGLPTSVLEAAAVGIPIIAADVGGTREIVKNGETGLLIQPGQPEQIAEAVRLLAQNRQMADELGREARRLVEKRFDWDKVIDDWLECVLSCQDQASVPQAKAR